MELRWDRHPDRCQCGTRLPPAKCIGPGPSNDPKKIDEYRCRNDHSRVEGETPSPGKQSHADCPAAKACRSTGSFRKRTPVAANSALASAGAAPVVPGSPMPAGRFDASNQMNFYPWRFIDPHHPVVIEVALLNSSLGERDLAVKGCTEAKNHASLNLGDNRVWIHDDAAVDRAHNAPHVDPAMLVDLDLSDCREVGTKDILDRDTASYAARQSLTPPRFARYQIQAGEQARRFPHWSRRNPTGSFPALCASSSTKLSVTKIL